MRAYVALGGNQGDPQARVREAFAALDALPDTRVRKRSSLYLTPPWGVTDQPDFINAAAALDTALDPWALMQALLEIERQAGRTRDGQRWGPRTLDLDLLLYGDRVIDEPGLSVPHPRIAERAFVLLPLAELDPALDVPGQGRVDALLKKIDASACKRLPPPT
ncbi:2-amino-4-hydroxy-6-hydroxymethyldihydropteridine diphosphokinase [Oleiagrimonas soli]|uniref:2-amino-4-hydroxy-6-hydroxymethyldihydropteridine pyrophosphokinase n=1 Tax=Oleiagrimonas soli TaxID=1543381 RepID=A0A841KFI0_9GAMM|nr:2-amino-4-hydroxy-6-hydroxymethyldihydropteridine diphosphokinase [Oleiagrimonas soli]